MPSRKTEGRIEYSPGGTILRCFWGGACIRNSGSTNFGFCLRVVYWMKQLCVDLVVQVEFFLLESSRHRSETRILNHGR